MGPLRYTSGDPLSIRKSDASVLVANNAKIVSMHLALMLSQSMKPRAYATGSHILFILARVPPFERNQSVKLSYKRKNSSFI
jgi:hypothetical protein